MWARWASHFCSHSFRFVQIYYFFLFFSPLLLFEFAFFFTPSNYNYWIVADKYYRYCSMVWIKLYVIRRIIIIFQPFDFWNFKPFTWKRNMHHYINAIILWDVKCRCSEKTVEVYKSPVCTYATHMLWVYVTQWIV